MLLLDRRLPNGHAIEIAQGHHTGLNGRQMKARRDVHWMTIVRVVTDLDKDSSRFTMRTIDSLMMTEETDMAAMADAAQQIAETSTGTRIETTTTTTNDVAREVDRLKEHDLAHLEVVLRRAGNMASGLKESKSRLVGMCLSDNQMQETSGTTASPSPTSQQYARS